jgi:hypothetical protein
MKRRKGLGGHGGPPYQSSRAWGKLEISYSMPYALCSLLSAQFVICNVHEIGLVFALPQSFKKLVKFS